MRKKLRIKFHDETEEIREADNFEVVNNVLHMWRKGGVYDRYAEAWYPLNSLRGWEWVEG